MLSSHREQGCVSQRHSHRGPAALQTQKFQSMYNNFRHVHFKLLHFFRCPLSTNLRSSDLLSRGWPEGSAGDQHVTNTKAGDIGDIFSIFFNFSMNCNLANDLAQTFVLEFVALISKSNATPFALWFSPNLSLVFHWTFITTVWLRVVLSLINNRLATRL